ncbi:MAG TPA: PfkB family carbohydrate kinase [Candidatus Binataceae bacterium]|nr:PfkB family carbohydrate kinase [Candidatus Binataceae bacterium]
MPDTKLDVAGCGSMVVDLFYRAPRIIRADEKTVLSAHDSDGAIERARVGGLTLNHLGWARVLGLRTGIFGKIGDDRHGEFLRAGMDRFGIVHHLTSDGSASSFANVLVDSAGNRAIYMARGATAEITPAEIVRRHGAFIRGAHIVSTEISQLPLPAVIAILKLAREHSIPTVLDVDLPLAEATPMLGTRAELERAMRLATILKPAKTAAASLAAGKDPLAQAVSIRAKYKNRAVIITLGDQGCVIAAKDVALRAPAFRVKQIDSTGAGDAFLGGLLAAIRWKLPWDKAVRLANAAGAVCVTQLGAFPEGFELRGEIEKLYGAPLPAPRAAAPDVRPPSPAEQARREVREIDRFFGQSLEELTTLHRALDLDAIARAVEMIRAAQARGGRVHVTGVGKPEHVARYAASLFCSVGTPATFLHATETLHGSLGQVHPHDVVIAISNSGNTSELTTAAAAIKDQGADIIAVTGNRDSDLARLSDLVMYAPVRHEGGGLGLAPRISVLAEVFVLAGLSVALEVARGLTVEEYSRFHPAGALGETARRLAHPPRRGR